MSLPCPALLHGILGREVTRTGGGTGTLRVICDGEQEDLTFPATGGLELERFYWVDGSGNPDGQGQLAEDGDLEGGVGDLLRLLEECLASHGEGPEVSVTQDGDGIITITSDLPIQLLWEDNATTVIPEWFGFDRRRWPYAAGSTEIDSPFRHAGAWFPGHFQAEDSLPTAQEIGGVARSSGGIPETVVFPLGLREQTIRWEELDGNRIRQHWADEEWVLANLEAFWSWVRDGRPVRFYQDTTRRLGTSYALYRRGMSSDAKPWRVVDEEQTTWDVELNLIRFLPSFDEINIRSLVLEGTNGVEWGNFTGYALTGTSFFFWIKPSAIVNEAQILNFTDASSGLVVAVQLMTGGELRIFLGPTAYLDTEDLGIVADEWNPILISKDGTTVRVWNGTTEAGVVPESTPPASLGGAPCSVRVGTSGGTGLSGLVNQIAICNAVLTPRDVILVGDRPKSLSKLPGLVFHAEFEAELLERRFRRAGSAVGSPAITYSADTPPGVEVVGGEPPTIDAFTINASAVDFDARAGAELTLAWTVTGADTVSINQGIGSVDPSSGSHGPVSAPEGATTYTITAENEAGTVNASIVVTGIRQVISRYTWFRSMAGQDLAGADWPYQEAGFDTPTAKGSNATGGQSTTGLAALALPSAMVDQAVAPSTSTTTEGYSDSATSGDGNQHPTDRFHLRLLVKPRTLTNSRFFWQMLQSPTRFHQLTWVSAGSTLRFQVYHTGLGPARSIDFTGHGIADDAWQLIDLVFSGDEGSGSQAIVRLFVNGVQVGTDEHTSGTFDTFGNTNTLFGLMGTRAGASTQDGDYLFWGVRALTNFADFALADHQADAEALGLYTP